MEFLTIITYLTESKKRPIRLIFDFNIRKKTCLQALRISLGASYIRGRSKSNQLDTCIEMDEESLHPFGDSEGTDLSGRDTHRYRPRTSKTERQRELSLVRAEAMFEETQCVSVAAPVNKHRGRLLGKLRGP